MAGVFIAGTDTDVGKTYLSTLLLKTLRSEGVDAVGFKPVCCGERTDSENLFAASGEVEPLDEVNPIWFRTPVAPAVALQLEGGEINAAGLAAHGKSLEQRHKLVVCEGIGGWEVPLTRTESCSDLARELGWPVLLVVANRLGALNHTLLTVGAIKQAGLPLIGVVLNHLEEERDVAMVSNESILRDRIETEVWTTLMPEQDWLEADFVTSLRGILL